MEIQQNLKLKRKCYPFTGRMTPIHPQWQRRSPIVSVLRRTTPHHHHHPISLTLSVESRSLTRTRGSDSQKFKMIIQYLKLTTRKKHHSLRMNVSSSPYSISKDSIPVYSPTNQLPRSLESQSVPISREFRELGFR